MTFPPLLALLAFAATSNPLKTVALTGRPAPGTPEGVVFAGFVSTDPRTPVPMVDEQGRVLFFAFLAGPGVDATNGHGLWTSAGAGAALVARAGDPAPGTGVNFQGLPNAEVPVGFDISDGLGRIPATLTGASVDVFNDDGFWQGDAATLELVLREGEPAPGTGATFFTPGLVEANAAATLFASRLRGPGITDANDETIWSRRDAGLVLHAREGNPAPGTNVRFGPGSIGAGPSVFPFADQNGAGVLLLRGNLSGNQVDAFNDEALFIDRGNGLQLYLREGAPAPGAGNQVVFGGGSVQLMLNFPTVNALGEVAFPVRIGRRKGRNFPTTDAIYSDHLGSLMPIAIAGKPSVVAGKNWEVVRAPVLSDGSRVAFPASVDPDFRPRHGIFWDQSGSVATLILPDAPAPERPGLTVYDAIPIRGYTAAGLLVFEAVLLDQQSMSRTAALSAEPDGTLHTLVAAGDLVDVSNGGGDLRTVRDVHAGEVGEEGTLALRLHFTDGSSGIFTVGVPGS